MTTIDRPIRARRDSQGKLDRVAQFSGELLGADLDTSVSKARDQVCRWLQKRIPERLPQSAFAGEPFEIDYPGHHAASVRLIEDELDYWCAKFDHPDHNHTGRSWMVEVAVAHAASQALFGLRLSCFSVGSVPAPEKSTPGVLRQVVDVCGLGEAGIPFTPTGWVVGQNLDFGQFVRLLESTARSVPIYAISTPHASEQPADALLDVRALSRACLGLAHVVVLPGSAAFQLTDAVGKDFSVFHGAVRTYHSGFNRLQDSPSRHPIAMAQTVEGGAPWGDGSFFDFLVERAYETSARAEGSQRRLPSFSSVKRIVAERKRTSATQAGIDIDSLELFEAEIESLKLENRELEADIQEFDELASECQAEAEAAKRDSHWLKVENDRLRKLAEASGIASEVDLPESIQQLPEWAEKQLVGRLALHPRAIRAVKKASYEDPGLVYKALLALANEYRDMKLAVDQSLQEPFLKAMKELGIDYGPSIERTRANEQGATYFVEWRQRNRFLENHLKKGSSKDERHTLRIYFFWDEDEQLVVVGSLPGHLQTRAT